MSRPRIFVSSTYYDLKHVRSSLDNFIESLGFESVLSEKGDIAYSPESPLDESCYREATTSDIFVLVIGGRYGSASSSEEKKMTRAFFERYDSVTKKEYESANSRDIPVYILIEQNVYTEYHTYLRNKDSKDTQYAHVDSINVFRLIEDILSKPRNNPVHTFERFSEIESWLREQWAGLFKELLQRLSSQKQIASLSSQVDTLSAISATMQSYLETVVTKVSPDDATELIRSEHKRLLEIEKLNALKHNDFYQGVFHNDVDVSHFKLALERAESFSDFAKLMGEISGRPDLTNVIMGYEHSAIPLMDINDARMILEKKPFAMNKAELDEVKEFRTRKVDISKFTKRSKASKLK